MEEDVPRLIESDSSSSSKSSGSDSDSDSSHGSHPIQNTQERKVTLFKQTSSEGRRDDELNKDIIDYHKDDPYDILNPTDDPSEETKDGPKKKRKKAIYGRLSINVNYCHYPVVRTVAKMNKIKITYSDEEDWDILWSDGAQ